MLDPPPFDTEAERTMGTAEECTRVLAVAVLVTGALWKSLARRRQFSERRAALEASGEKGVCIPNSCRRSRSVEAEEALFAKYAELENALAERRASDKQREGRLQTLRATHEDSQASDRLMAEIDSPPSSMRMLRKGHSRVDQLVARDEIELENAAELARVRKSLAKERDGAAALSVQLTRERSESGRAASSRKTRVGFKRCEPRMKNSQASGTD